MSSYLSKKFGAHGASHYVYFRRWILDEILEFIIFNISPQALNETDEKLEKWNDIWRTTTQM